ncbi:ABC transporter substrate-binding protein [Rubrivivax gelatinosus]|uniref:ABC transporter substrate-binding protein n=1 Tax=Rubrivivax gelatinosus TaxID=28068 RepID=UPI001903842F|nr:extracellular solute-binding protein [Rubrivivax gelatinosus]MBK1614451.1 ABC transporter substrate-binding protein [Rubrivivax gelatinosus]
MATTSSTRRRFLAGCAAVVAAAGLPAAQARSRRPVVVLTAYPQETISRFEAAFEKAEPGARLQVLWRLPHEMPAYLASPEGRGVDLVWAASPRTFQALKRDGALAVLDAQDVPRAGLPERLGGTTISDPDGHFLATEIAGYGFVYAPRQLADLGLAVPADWPDLAAPHWAGRIAAPVPSRVGFAPVLVDIVLQAFGWERGWALWSAIAGNARWVNVGGTLIGDEVASGRAAIGLTIDFFAASAVARGAPLRFAYPAHGGVNPAHVALLRRAPNRAGALAFVRYVLSDAGQLLLADPGIRKLPVRPSVYARLPADYFNPFEAAARGGYGYDNAATQPRLGLLAALFEQAFVVDHAEHAALWRQLHAAEAAGRDVAAARALLEAPPLDAAAAADPGLAAQLHFVEHGAPVPASALEQGWRAAAAQRRRQAAALLA